ncbi:hypothetical protein [Bacillus thuringiensis]|uniref:hypothetical protein n=1 Tax=Bacillus thuringiensis TaxID=1428 RepID=UPI001643665F|nr:hypothetical protein [Bacillus thuringiensis]
MGVGDGGENIVWYVDYEMGRDLENEGRELDNESVVGVIIVLIVVEKEQNNTVES